MSSQKPLGYWRSRPDPFADAWDTEVVPMLANAPQLQAITILRKLQDDHAGQYPDSTRRTLERRVRQWRAMSGPPKEVFFPRQHEPGARGLSDFTDMAEVRVTIAGIQFDHRLYHFVLAFSRWEYVNVVEGGESFEALSMGLQNAMWRAGDCPREHRTDSLSAAFRNLADEDDFTARYAALLEHYGMHGTRNNRGLGHKTRRLGDGQHCGSRCRFRSLNMCRHRAVSSPRCCSDCLWPRPLTPTQRCFPGQRNARKYRR